MRRIGATWAYAIHTTDLLAKNSTKDREINEMSLKDLLVVVTKDTDFFYSTFASRTALETFARKDGQYVPEKPLFTI